MFSFHRTAGRNLRKAFQCCLRQQSVSPLRMLMAEKAFQQGNLELALKRYRKLENDPDTRAKSLLIQDWIDFYRGDYSVGWPRYPGADFNAPQPAKQTASLSDAIHVTNPRRPYELAKSLCLQRWQGRTETQGRLLVWFNFKSSLGAELLACRLIRAFQFEHNVPLTVACDPRLVSLLRSCLPECQVIDKTSDLRPLLGQGTHYVMARDLLGMLISGPEDFERLQGAPLIPSPNPKCISKSHVRPQIAISWKTTNTVQGRTRNLPLDRFAKTLANPHVEWHIGQHGDIAKDIDQLKRLAPKATLHLKTLTPQSDLLTFARELEPMDAVLTIDNTLLHLAGSLGIKTFAMIAIPSYWAWPAEGQHCRWYDSVQIIRQPEPGNWSAVLDAIDIELEQLTFSTC